MKLVIIIKKDDFVNVIRKGPKVWIKLNDTWDRYNLLPYNYQSKVGYETLVQNVILKELIIILGGTITDSDKELKMKISKNNYLESR